MPDQQLSSALMNMIRRYGSWSTFASTSHGHTSEAGGLSGAHEWRRLESSRIFLRRRTVVDVVRSGSCVHGAQLGKSGCVGSGRCARGHELEGGINT